MASKKKTMQVTKEQLRTTFAILRSQMRLAEEELELKAINEFSRELNCMWEEAIDKRAQRKGSDYDTELELIAEESKSWTADAPRIT